MTALDAPIALADVFRPHDRPACWLHPDLFDPPRRGETSKVLRYIPQRHKDAIAICESCGLLEACRAWVMRRPLAEEDDHIYAGMTGWQRREERTGSRRKIPKGKHSYGVTLNPEDITGGKGCRRGHPPSSRYNRPNGDLRCKECDAFNAQTARRNRLMKEAAA